MANILALPDNDLGLIICAEIPGVEQICPARALIHHRAGIAASVAIIRPDKLGSTPDCTAVLGSSDERVNISAISSCATLTKGQ